MSEEFNYPDRRTPRVTPTFVLWTMAVVVVAGITTLVLALPVPGDGVNVATARPASVSPTGEVDQSWSSAPASDSANSRGTR